MLYNEDLKHIVGEEPLDVISLLNPTPKDLGEVMVKCSQADLLIFRANGKLPLTIIQEFASAGLLDQFTQLSCPKVFWSQDSHHAHAEEVRGQNYFDRYYIAHANYLDRFDKNRTCYLPCCYGASSLDFLQAINAEKFEKHFDIGSFYVQYPIGDRNIVMHNAKNIIAKRNLTFLFGKLYGSFRNFIDYVDMLRGIVTTDMILNVSLIDDLNIRNFEAIAFNKKLIANELNDYKLINLDYSNTFFYKRDMSNFEDILVEAMESESVKTWESVYSENCLIHRYVGIISYHRPRRWYGFSPLEGGLYRVALNDYYPIGN